MHVGQSALDAVVIEGQPCVVDAQQMQDRGVEVMDIDRLLGDLPTDVVRRPVGEAALEALDGAAGDAVVEAAGLAADVGVSALVAAAPSEAAAAGAAACSPLPASLALSLGPLLSRKSVTYQPEPLS